jgi:signal transduction histidine kinase
MSRTRQTFRTLLFLVAALPLGAIGFAVLVTGWTTSLVFAITPLAVPVLVSFRFAVGQLARAEAALARALLGTTAQPPTTSPALSGYWRRGLAVLGDEAFWRQQVYLLQRFVLGGTLAIAELALIGASASLAVLPIWYRWSQPDVGTWHIVTLQRAFLCVPVGIIGLVAAILLVRPLTSLSRSLVGGLLTDRMLGDPSWPADSLPAGNLPRRRWLAFHASVFAFLVVLTTLIWALTTRAYYWPMWLALPLSLPLAVHAWVVLVDERPERFRRLRLTRALTIHLGASLSLSLFMIGIWAASHHHHRFWPVWPILAFGIVLAVHAAIVAVDAMRRGELSERIATLESSRAGAVDQQETELRRIERDLHDGAQARLVALGMSLGMAEQKLVSDPAAAAELLADARRGAQEALGELRDLARGIHPPVLADRGLEAAISALANRTPLHVRVTVDIDDRPAPPVESAAYFVVAEALANTGKHARAEHVDIAIRRRRDSLFVEIDDDGVGGADPSGSGLSGLARRVEALDGTLEVTSPAGGPTKVRAVMPCGS